MRAFVFSLWLLAAPIAFSQEATPASSAIEDCIDRLQEDDIGMDALEARCPGIEQALADRGMLPFFDDWQRDRIGATGLSTLLQAEKLYDREPQTSAPDVTSLDAVLSDLQPPKAQVPATRFERFQRWLRDLFSKRADKRDSWLSRWLEDHSLSEAARKAMLLGSVLLVVALAIAFVVNEIRVARKGRRKQDSGAAGQLGMFDPSADDVLDLDAAARNDRPSILLRLLIRTLVKTGRLQAERSLTHRELMRHARFDNDSQYESFVRVAQLAERVVYGGDARAEDLDEVIQAGRTLNKKLSGAT